MKINAIVVYNALEQYVCDLNLVAPSHTWTAMAFIDGWVHTINYSFNTVWFFVREPIHIFYKRLRDAYDTKSIPNI